eukprot:TRINITY_DN14665_c0_g1_i5.p3 TRINITY_DN14665_c0_g1~~TRINITY_DN14665_c0_g1_i5.p3  ORF type:complete len:163 (+),score=43.53 TRINITY_DN14665_c0_g1_i5:120-608(+)
MSFSQQRGVGLSDAAEHRWRQHLDRASDRPSAPPSQAPASRPSCHSGLACAIPTQELLEEMTRGPNAQPLPRSFQRWVNAGPFVPPEGEEWHVLDGFHVRISQAELDAILERAAESDDGEDDVDSLADADTSVGSSSDYDDDEDLQLTSDGLDDEWSDELGM